MKQAAKKPVRKKRAPRGRVRRDTYYVVAIEDWDWSVWFGVNKTPERGGPYSDYRHLLLYGKVLRPALKADSVELTLLPEDALNEGNRELHNPTAIGSLHLYRGTLRGLVSIPADLLPSLLTMLTADKLRYAVLSGDKLRYNQATLRDFRLQRDLEEEDFPPED